MKWEEEISRRARIHLVLDDLIVLRGELEKVGNAQRRKVAPALEDGFTNGVGCAVRKLDDLITRWKGVE